MSNPAAPTFAKGLTVILTEAGIRAKAHLRARDGSRKYTGTTIGKVVGFSRKIPGMLRVKVEFDGVPTNHPAEHWRPFIVLETSIPENRTIPEAYAKNLQDELTPTQQQQRDRSELEAKLDAAQIRVLKLEKAIRWACGEVDFDGWFPAKPDGAPAFWWRPHLRKRAGL